MSDNKCRDLLVRYQMEINKAAAKVAESQRKMGEDKIIPHIKPREEEVSCEHKWKETQGITNTYKDCTECGMKWEDYEEVRILECYDKRTNTRTVKFPNGSEISFTDEGAVEALETINGHFMQMWMDRTDDLIPAFDLDTLFPDKK